MPCSAVLRVEEEIELFEADLEAMGCGEGRAKVCSLLTDLCIPPKCWTLTCPACGLGAHSPMKAVELGATGTQQHGGACCGRVECLSPPPQQLTLPAVSALRARCRRARRSWTASSSATAGTS